MFGPRKVHLDPVTICLRIESGEVIFRRAVMGDASFGSFSGLLEFCSGL